MSRRSHLRSLVAPVALLTALPGLLAAQAGGAACRSAGSGGFSMDSLEVAYSVSHDGEAPHVDALVLVRAPAEWRRRAPDETRPAARRPDGSLRLLSGGTVGPMWVQYERRTGTLWLDVDSVAIGAANVALVEVDPSGRPSVVGTARVEPRLSLLRTSCGPPATREESLAFQAALLSAARRDPSARAFLDR